MQNSKQIYHYCSLRTAIEFILPSTQLLLNTVGNSNDPRETKVIILAFQNRERHWKWNLTFGNLMMN